MRTFAHHTCSQQTDQDCEQDDDGIYSNDTEKINVGALASLLVLSFSSTKDQERSEARRGNRVD